MIRKAAHTRTTLIEMCALRAACAFTIYGAWSLLLGPTDPGSRGREDFQGLYTPPSPYLTRAGKRHRLEYSQEYGLINLLKSVLSVP